LAQISGTLLAIPPVTVRIFDTTLRLLSSALDARQRRHDVLSSNLANADTPGYRGKDMNVARATARKFQADETALLAGEAQASLGIERAKALTIDSSPENAMEQEIAELDGASAGLDGNTVDLDRTMAALAENGLEYAAITGTINKKMGLIRYILSEGR